MMEVNMMEIRVYYESLEQAQHYILPIIYKGLGQSQNPEYHNVKIVTRARNQKGIRNGLIKCIYQMTTPDFLITITDGNIEIPLIVGEFSESVQTEDHELQRAVGGIAAGIVNAIYLKISGDKASNRPHGGNTNFNPYYIPKAMEETLNYHGFILSKWKTADDNPHVLLRNDQYKSCPAPNAANLAEYVIEKVIAFAIKIPNLSSTNIAEEFFKAQINDSIFKSYLEDVSKASSISDTLLNWGDRTPNNNWRRIEVEKDKIIIKINRYSHAADPDRGILLFFSCVANKDLVLTRYSVEVSSNMGKIETLVEQYCKKAIEEGLPSSFLSLIKNGFNSTTNCFIDLTADLTNIKKEIFSNKVLFSLIVFGDGIVVHSCDNSLKINIYWSREKLFGKAPKKTLEYLKSVLNSNDSPKALNIKQVTEEINEDEVTYINVHQILKKNGFKIVSVSYPGAQGDLSILPDRAKGRSQERLYIDIIAWLPSLLHSHSRELTLEEAKGRFVETKINQDVNKLKSFKDDPSKRKALNEALTRTKEPLPTKIVIGIAFGTNKNSKATWNPADVDYIVRIFGRSRWELAFFGSYLKDCFRIVEGPVCLPIRYSIVNENS